MSETLNETGQELSKALKQFKKHLNRAKKSFERTQNIESATHYKNMMLFYQQLANYDEGERIRKLKQWLIQGTKKPKKEVDMNDVIRWGRQLYEAHMDTLDEDDPQTQHTRDAYYRGSDNSKNGQAMWYLYQQFGHPEEAYRKYHKSAKDLRERELTGQGIARSIQKQRTGLEPVKSSFDWTDLVSKLLQKLLYKETGGRGLQQYIADEMKKNKSIVNDFAQISHPIPKKSTPHIVQSPPIFKTGQGIASLKKGPKKGPNAWIKFIKEFKAKNPHLSHKEAMIQASPLYQASK